MKRRNYTWVIVALCFLMVFTCLGFCSSNSSLYLNAITEALDIKRSVYSLTNSFRFVTTAIINLFFGRLVSRYGTKKLIGAGFLSLITAMLLYAHAENVVLFYLGGIFLGVGMSWTTTTMVGSVVNKWCKENRGTVMGAVLAANGLGGALAAQIVTPIIYQEGNAFGYRSAYKLVAIILIAVGALVMIFFRENPKGEENAPTVVHKKKARGQAWVGMDFSEAKKHTYFYVAAACIFFTGFVLQGVNGTASAHMKDVGLDMGYVATVLSAHSIALTCFKFLTGFLYDRFGLRVTMTICDIAALVAMLSLALLTGNSTGAALAMVYGVISSLALPLETIMLPIFANDFFGDKSYNKMLGIFVSVNTAGYALGGPVMNLIYDMCGSYKPMFIACALMMAAITIVSQFTITSFHRRRDEIIRENAAE